MSIIFYNFVWVKQQTIDIININDMILFTETKNQ